MQGGNSDFVKDKVVQLRQDVLIIVVPVINQFFPGFRSLLVVMLEQKMCKW